MNGGMKEEKAFLTAGKPLFLSLFVYTVVLVLASLAQLCTNVMRLFSRACKKT